MDRSKQIAGRPVFEPPPQPEGLTAGNRRPPAPDLDLAALESSQPAGWYLAKSFPDNIPLDGCSEI